MFENTRTTKVYLANSTRTTHGPAKTRKWPKIPSFRADTLCSLPLSWQMNTQDLPSVPQACHVPCMSWHTCTCTKRVLALVAPKSY